MQAEGWKVPLWRGTGSVPKLDFETVQDSLYPERKQTRAAKPGNPPWAQRKEARLLPTSSILVWGLCCNWGASFALIPLQTRPLFLRGAGPALPTSHLSLLPL